MDPIGEVQHTIRQGVFRLCSDDQDRDTGMQSQVPLVIRWLKWGPPSTTLQAGVLVSIDGSQWKVQDVSRRDSSKLRLIKEVGRFEHRKHTERFVTAASITPAMHEAKWYQVFSACGPQRSPRRFFQQPEGCMNLFLDPRFAEPTVRVHTDSEVWHLDLIHFGLPTASRQRQAASQVRAALTDKQLQECAAGAVTFRTTE